MIESEGENEERVDELDGGKIKEVKHNKGDRQRGEPGLERDARKANAAEVRREHKYRLGIIYHISIFLIYISVTVPVNTARVHRLKRRIKANS